MSNQTFDPWDYRNPETQAPGYVFPSDTAEQRQAGLSDYFHRQAESQGHIPKGMDPNQLNLDLLNKNAFNISSGTYPSSSSGSQSTSESAIDWSTSLGRTLLPLITAQANKLPGLVSSLPGVIQGRYDSLMREAMSPQNFQGVLNQLVNKGMLSSTFGENSLGRAVGQIAKSIADKGYESELQGVHAQMQLPGILGQLAELARVSSAQSTSQSAASNPLAPYELMLKAMMY